MADYYPLLAKALAGLPATTTLDARRAIYDRARKALIGQLRSLKPPLSEDVIAREEAALDAAVARLEDERSAAPASPTATGAPPASAAAAAPVAAPSNAATAPAVPRPAPQPPRPAPPPRPQAASPAPARAAVSGSRPGAPPGAATNLRPAVSVSASAPQANPQIAPPRYAPPPRPASPPPLPGQANPAPRPQASSPPSIAATAEPSAAPPPIGAAAAWSPSAPPPVTAPEAFQEEGYAPPIAATASVEEFAAPPVRAAGESGRPAAPSRAKPRPRSVWPWIALAVLLIVVAVIGGFAVLWKEKPQDLAIKETAEAPAKPAANNQSKIVERVPGAGPAATPTPPTAPAPANTAPATPAPQTPANPAAETPIPTVTVPTVPVHPNETAQAGAQTAATQPATAPAIARAALLIEAPSDPQKPKVLVGTATWSLVPAASGQAQAAGPTVQVDIDIPDAKLHATVTIRKNTDASLPATHTIDLRFNVADGADIKGFKDMALPQMRRDDTPTGDALSGVRVKINDDYFLVGLTRSDADTTHNLELLGTRNWLDFPLLFNDDHIAKLTFEKGATGQSVLAQAIEAWK